MKRRLAPSMKPGGFVPPRKKVCLEAPSENEKSAQVIDDVENPKTQEVKSSTPTTLVDTKPALVRTPLKPKIGGFKPPVVVKPKEASPPTPVASSSALSTSAEPGAMTCFEVFWWKRSNKKHKTVNDGKYFGPFRLVKLELTITLVRKGS
jgi:hypothetical protein